MDPLSKLLVIISYEASDPDWTKDNPHGLSVIEVHDAHQQEAIVKKICDIIADYKENEVNWNYQDAIAQAEEWLESEGYSKDINVERIDLG